MKNTIDDKLLVSANAQKMGSVFSLADLAVLFAEPHKTQLYRRIAHLEERGVLRRFVRGLYVTEVTDELPLLPLLSQRLCADSYESFATVLSDHLLIGSKPRYRLDAVKRGKSRTYTDGKITVRHFGSDAPSYFGFATEAGIRRASPEKAVLDLLYYHQHGASFGVDIYSDIDFTRIDRQRLLASLAHYRNPKFKAFVSGVINETA